MAVCNCAEVTLSSIASVTGYVLLAGSDVTTAVCRICTLTHVHTNRLLHFPRHTRDDSKLLNINL